MNTKEVEDFVPHTSDDLKVTRLCHHHSDRLQDRKFVFAAGINHGNEKQQLGTPPVSYVVIICGHNSV